MNSFLINRGHREQVDGVHREKPEFSMLVLGIVCLLIGLLFGIPILWTIGIILAVVGAVLWLLGGMGREVGGRRYWY